MFDHEHWSFVHRARIQCLLLDKKRTASEAENDLAVFGRHQCDYQSLHKEIDEKIESEILLMHEASYFDD